MFPSLAASLRAPWAAGALPWSAKAWRNTVFVVAGIPVHTAGLVVTVAPLELGLAATPLSVSLTVMLLMTLVFGAACAVLLTVVTPLLTRLQRSRLRALSAVDIAGVELRSGTGWRARAGMIRSESLWRQVAYHVLAGPAASLGALAALAAWALGCALTVLPLFAWALPASSPLNPGAHPTALATTWLLGPVLLFMAPPLTRLVARTDIAAAQALLGPSRAGELQRRVDRLAVSRAALLDAADAERRRIERDLHDGVQQRLVSLAMRLGLARATLPGLSSEAKELLANVHTEAKDALTELRDLVRGLHPAVLDEEGLDAALSGIAARAPFPVRLRVSAEGRAAPAIEAVAYFVVSESLANIAKHARATQAEIRLERDADRLRVTVIDDGVGGADPTGGTGLAGLANRVSSVDGTLSVSSPAGGGTRITVELPCVL
ncbi:sensor histidine kinase [Streptomyces sp. NBC_00988]|uniref:sensor histidine kinase n=1 Tax=Streptomyces sp. NBC_00988 TaxID=2903704 RepID=UPI00386367BC|nr:sensor histidine kinase [Streptomyces sp. NBC_00988]